MILFLSCEKEVDWELKTVRNIDLVVDGFITDELKQQELRLSLPIYSLNEIPEPASGAIVFVTAGPDTFDLNEKLNDPGLYIADTMFQGVSGENYTLHINIDGKQYFAVTHLVPVTPFDSLELIYNKKTKLFRVFPIAENFASRPSYYRLYIDWSNVPGYESLPPDSTYAELAFFSLNSLGVNQVFSPEVEEVWFPEGTIIIEQKYSLTPEHAEYMHALVSETAWRGGFFDVEAANVPTNLSAGAIGFYGGSSVITDTIVVSR